MRAVFADTGYWIALANPHDTLHQKALNALPNPGSCRIVTSDMVLAEVLNMFAEKGTHLRQAAADAVQQICSDPTIEVVPQTRRLFNEALGLYRTRLDKAWSLTDCASHVIMKQRDISHVLTHDHHFTQMGYTVLL